MSKAPKRQCGNCRYFDDDPVRFEQALPGLLALSSGGGDTKGDQGLCARHDRMVAPQLTCGDFAPLSPDSD